MTNVVVLAGATVLALAGATSGRPQSGTDVDEVRTHHVNPTRPANCVSYARPGGTLLFDADRLTSIVANDPPSWQTEWERVDHLAAQRAKQLLDHATGTPDRFGCTPIDSTVPLDAFHLLIQEVEADQVSVAGPGGALQAMVDVHYYAQTCGPLCGSGVISVEMHGSKNPLLFVIWWMA